MAIQEGYSMLLDFAPNFRHSDPRSSQDAGVAVEKKGKAQKQRDIAQRLVATYPGRTSKELARISGMDRYALARRLPELLRAGVVRRTEEGECRWWICSEEQVVLKLWDEV